MNTETLNDRREELAKYLTGVSLENMLEWLEESGWNNYDSIETWVKGNWVVGTKTLVDIFNAREK